MAFNIQNSIRENVQKMQPYSSARDEFQDFDQPMTFLDANENPFENGVNRYPDPMQKQLKTVLATQKKCQPEQILLGNGSDEVLDLLFRAFCNPLQDNIITLPPTYGMYDVLANLNAIENRAVVLNNDFQPNVEAILNAVDKQTKMIFLCSPNNPTGNSFSEQTILQILQKFNGLVVIDEAYIDFAEQASWLEKINQFPNLVITQTLSKAVGLAGIRLGILYADAAIVAVLNKIKPPYNINELTQQRALERLQNTTAIASEINTLKQERSQLLAQLATISFVEKIVPTAANFVLIKVDDASKRYQQLLNLGIVVRNRSTQPLCGNTLRITIGTPEENKQLITILQQL